MSLKQVELTFAVLRASKQSLHKLEFRVAFKRKEHFDEHSWAYEKIDYWDENWNNIEKKEEGEFA